MLVLRWWRENTQEGVGRGGAASGRAEAKSLQVGSGSTASDGEQMLAVAGVHKVHVGRAGYDCHPAAVGGPGQLPPGRRRVAWQIATVGEFVVIWFWVEQQSCDVNTGWMGGKFSPEDRAVAVSRVGRTVELELFGGSHRHHLLVGRSCQLDAGPLIRHQRPQSWVYGQAAGHQPCYRLQASVPGHVR